MDRYTLKVLRPHKNVVPGYRIEISYIDRYVEEHYHYVEGLSQTDAELMVAIISHCWQMDDFYPKLTYRALWHELTQQDFPAALRPLYDDADGVEPVRILLSSVSYIDESGAMLEVDQSQKPE